MSAAQRNTAPLSPVSTELEGPCVDGGSSSSTTGPSQLPHTASAGSLWSPNYQEESSSDDVDPDANWRQDAGDGEAVPKMEPIDDDSFRMEDVQEAPRGLVARSHPTPSSPPKVKRPRGRPRKHPLAPQEVGNKVAKGRSKTGCITCRKRKKKCDEAKPRCLNCEKNAVVCEGYHEKTIWKSGRERAEEERQRKQSLPQITLQPIFQGVETAEDRIFLNHYINGLSSVLTVEGQHKNAFKDMLLQMAMEHRGLMHSILSLAGRHIDFDTPYGSKLLGSSPGLDRDRMMARAQYHHDQAMPHLLSWGVRDQGQEEKANLAPRYGQMLCLLLQTAAEGSRGAQHRVHLHAYKSLILENPPPDKNFTTFISEFFQYRVFADELIRYPGNGSRRLATEDWEPWYPIEPARLIGVGDGLFHYLAKITTIRNEIRSNMETKVEPVVNFAAVYRALEIEAAIRSWAPVWPAGDNRNSVNLLYKQMMWIYLFRTIFPPVNSSAKPFFANTGMTTTTTTTDTTITGMMVSAPIDGSAGLSGQGILGAAVDGAGGAIGHRMGVGDGSSISPPSPASSNPCSSTRSPPSSALGSKSSDRRSSSGTMPMSPRLTTANALSCTPTTRFPPQHDLRISLAVDESLVILETFKPSDPVQTLLLVPCLIIGCASFIPSQQERVRNAVRTVRGYTGLHNCDCVAELLEEIWRLMARGDWMRVWDWQRVANDMELDFTCA
ncbi:hypothetical protein GGS20DRAFT_577408 [Poronia punctata]|nr:hypothetical protein GGS20DRAFT_577408 [Poronia punctata]